MHCIVEPVLHKYEDIPAGAQSWVLPPGQIVVLPEIEQVIPGLWVTVKLHVELHVPLLTLPKYVPGLDTVIHCVVAPVFHEYAWYPAGRQSCVDPPGQIVELPVIWQLSGGLIVTILLQLLVQLPLLTVTVYVPDDDTLMHWVLAPVLHEYDDIPAGAHNCVEEPVHAVDCPVIEQLGELTDTVLLQLLVQPPLLIVTEYVPAEFTLMHCVVAPVLHE
jgi:hypothetical protein